MVNKSNLIKTIGIVGMGLALGACDNLNSEICSYATGSDSQHVLFDTDGDQKPDFLARYSDSTGWSDLTESRYGVGRDFADQGFKVAANQHVQIDRDKVIGHYNACVKANN